MYSGHFMIQNNVLKKKMKHYHWETLKAEQPEDNKRKDMKHLGQLQYEDNKKNKLENSQRTNAAKFGKMADDDNNCSLP